MQITSLGSTLVLPSQVMMCLAAPFIEEIFSS